MDWRGRGEFFAAGPEKAAAAARGIRGGGAASAAGAAAAELSSLSSSAATADLPTTPLMAAASLSPCAAAAAADAAASASSSAAAASSSSMPSISSPPLHLFEDQDKSCLSRCCSGLKRLFCGVQPTYRERLLYLTGETYPRCYPTNAIKNTKYNLLTFLPIVLLQQFKFFFNFFYLAVALAQLLPVLQVGPLFTYLAPLAFVQFVSIAKEAYDDYKRYVRDREMNEQAYKRLTPEGLEPITAAEIRVGQIIQINANQRVPADVVFLRTTDASGSCFIRTDQLDGETDWKLRRAVHSTQHLPAAADLFHVKGWCRAEAPHLGIEEFAGQLVLQLSPSLLLQHPPASHPHSSSRGEDEAATAAAKDVSCGEKGAAASSSVVRQNSSSSNSQRQREQWGGGVWSSSSSSSEGQQQRGRRRSRCGRAAEARQEGEAAANRETIEEKKERSDSSRDYSRGKEEKSGKEKQREEEE